MDVKEAAELLEGFASGATEVLGVFEDRPLVVVETEAGDRLDVPALFPAVVVATGEGGAGADLAITSGTSGTSSTSSAGPSSRGAGRSWVTVADLDEAVRHVAEGVERAPRAAVTFVQLLRISAGRPVDDGLAMESLAYSVLQSGPEFAAWRARYSRPPRPDTAPPVLVDVDHDLLRITLNRPEVHNAYSRAMRDGLCSGLAIAAAAPSLSVYISGNGPSFCSGGDLREFGTFPDPATAHLVRTNRSPARMLHRMAGRVRVRLHGACVGSGIELPAFAGDVGAAPDTRIALPELAMGLIPGAGGTVSLPRRIGSARTAWLGLTGQYVDAPTALEWGLVDRLLDA